MNEYVSYQSEVQLTKNSSPRTLKSTAAIYMEEEIDELKEVTSKIRKFVKERKKSGVTADQAQAGRAVWETAFGRKLTSEETLRAVLGVPAREERPVDPVVNKQVEIIENIVESPEKFSKISDTLQGLSPEQARDSLKGQTGKIIVAMLAEDVDDLSPYFNRLDGILSAPEMEVKDGVQKLIDEIKIDCERIEEENKNESIEDSLVTAKKAVSVEKMQQAQKAWDEKNEEDRARGIEITEEELRVQRTLIKEGKGPIGGGTNGDGLFENIDFRTFSNIEVRKLAIQLRDLGIQNGINQKSLSHVFENARNLLANDAISETEYDQFNIALEPMIQEWMQKVVVVNQARQQENARPQTAKESQKRRTTHATELFNDALEEASGFENIDTPEQLATQKDLYAEKFEQVLAGINDKFGYDEKAELFKRELNGIQNTTDPKDYKRRITEFINRVKSAEVEEESDQPDNPKEGKKKSNKVQTNNILIVGQEEGWLAANMTSQEPKNIEDLAKWIMITDDARLWSPYSKKYGHPLFLLEHDVDDEGEILYDSNGNPKLDEEGNVRRKYDSNEIVFQPQNFIKWLRNKMLELHGDNPDDVMSPLQNVAIRTLFSPVSILSMKYDKQRYFSDPKTGEILDSLYNQVINEAWIFGVRRNHNLAYNQVMTSDEKLVETIVGINTKNEHTKGDNLEFVMSLPDNFDLDADKKDSKVGEGILFASQIYKNIPDFERLSHLLGPNSPFFTKEGFENAVRIIEGKGKWEAVNSFGSLLFEGDKIINVSPITGERKVLIDNNVLNKKNFIEYVNIFTSPNEHDTNVQVTRELVKAAIAKEFDFKTGIDFPPSEAEWNDMKAKALDQKRHISINFYRNAARINLEFAEINAFIEQRWNGQASRNDTNYRGFDAGTKVQAVQKYRERQSDANTAGPIGNRHDIPIFRNMAPEMWVAIKTEKNVTVQKIFEDIIDVGKELRRATSDADIKRLKEKQKGLYKSLRFPQNTQQDWAANQVKRAWEVWHSLLGTEDLGFDKLVTRNIWGDPQYHDGEFQKTVRDDFIKKRRYAFNSNNAIDYGAMTRVRDGDYVYVDPKKELPEGERYTRDKGLGGSPFYKDVTVADYMFGKVVTHPMENDWKKGKLQYEMWDPNINEGKGGKVIRNSSNGGSWQEFLSSPEARRRLFKNTVRAGLAAQIKAHRETHGTDAKWDRTIINNFIDSLKTIKAVKEDEHGEEEFLLDKKGQPLSFFTKEDLRWIRKEARVRQWRLLLEESAVTAAGALFGLPGLLSSLTKGLVDF